jgi:hypothetical protein
MLYATFENVAQLKKLKTIVANQNYILLEIIYLLGSELETIILQLF